MVVRGNQLAFVGSGAEARKLTRDAPGVRVIDARAQFVTPSGAGRVLRPGEPADFQLGDHDPSRPAPDATADPTGDVTAGAPPALVVRGGRVVDDR